MKLREARKKIFGQGGDLAIHGGGTENFLDGGGQVLMGGDSPFMGYGPPPSPPMLGTPVEQWYFTSVIKL